MQMLRNGLCNMYYEVFTKCHYCVEIKDVETGGSRSKYDRIR
jgi:hypothetical protein